MRMIKGRFGAVNLTALIFGLSCSTGASAQEIEGLPSQKFIPFNALSQMALAAESSCADKGFTVSVTVVDRDGVIRITLVGDHAAPVSTSASYRKAYTAANVGMTSAAFKRVVEMPGIGPVLSLDPLLIPFGGGVPIKLGNRVVGGIGVAGATSAEVDEECALAGLAQLAKHKK
jgi:uncharacterized protein GlcG (DUF336 family)